jgi:hypothetical protein
MSTPKQEIESFLEVSLHAATFNRMLIFQCVVAIGTARGRVGKRGFESNRPYG